MMMIKVQIKSFKEDTVKQGDHWVNKGDKGTHGKFKTKKAADAQRKAMFANGYHESELQEVTQDQFDKWDSSRQQQWLDDHPNSKFKQDGGSSDDKEPTKKNDDSEKKSDNKDLSNVTSVDNLPKSINDLETSVELSDDTKKSKDKYEQIAKNADAWKKIKKAFKSDPESKEKFNDITNKINELNKEINWHMRNEGMTGSSSKYSPADIEGLKDTIKTYRKERAQLVKDAGIEVPDNFTVPSKDDVFFNKRWYIQNLLKDAKVDIDKIDNIYSYIDNLK